MSCLVVVMGTTSTYVEGAALKDSHMELRDGNKIFRTLKQYILDIIKYKDISETSNPLIISCLRLSHF